MPGNFEFVCRAICFCQGAGASDSERGSRYNQEGSGKRSFEKETLGFDQREPGDEREAKNH